MRIRGHGNAVAIALAGLALVVAMGGTAVAVTATVVNIADPANPSRIARVDTNGRLSVAPPPSTINSAFYLSTGTNAMTSPTTASLAVSRVAVFNTALNGAYANTNFRVALVQLSVTTAGGSCYSSAPGLPLAIGRSAVGSQYQDLYDSPLVFRPVGGKPYCIGILLSSDASTTASAYYLPFGQVSGYVLSGNYNPSAKAAAAAAAPAPATPPVFQPNGPQPAGTAPLE